jgi:hypothetical protein
VIPHLNGKKLGVLASTCHLSHLKIKLKNSRTVVQTGLGKKQDRISKITRVKRTRGRKGSVVECLALKHKVKPCVQTSVPSK